MEYNRTSNTTIKTNFTLTLDNVFSLFNSLYSVGNCDEETSNTFVLERLDNLTPNTLNFVSHFDNSKHSKPKEFLIKIDNSNVLDIIQYEYYVGMALNMFKIFNVSNTFISTYDINTFNVPEKIIPTLKYNDYTDIDSVKKNIQEHLNLKRVCINNTLVDSIYNLKQNALITEYPNHDNKKLKPESFDHTIDPFINFLKRSVGVETFGGFLYRAIEYIQKYKIFLTSIGLDQVEIDRIILEQINYLEQIILKIVLIVLYNLSVVFKESEFVHNDLNLYNIQLIHLEKDINHDIRYVDTNLKEHVFTITLNIFPVITDYSKSYINQDFVEKAKQYYKTNIKDGESFVKNWYVNFVTFKEYRDTICKNDKIPKSLHTRFKRTHTIDVDNQITKFLNTYNIQGNDIQNKIYIIEKIYNDNYVNDFTVDFSEKTSTFTDNNNPKINTICYENRLRPHKSADMFKMMKMILDMFEPLRSVNTNYQYLWERLRKQINLEYPFYIPDFYILPSDYSIKNFLLNLNIQSYNLGHITCSKDMLNFIIQIMNNRSYYSDLSSLPTIDIDNALNRIKSILTRQKSLVVEI